MSESGAPYKRLYRSRSEKMLGGICGGLAEYFGIDPTWMRLIFIFFTFLGGFALILYLIMWVVVPLKPTQDDSSLNGGNKNQ